VARLLSDTVVLAVVLQIRLWTLSDTLNVIVPKIDIGLGSVFCLSF